MLDLQSMLMPQLKERKTPDGTATLQALAGLVAGGAKAPPIPKGTPISGGGSGGATKLGDKQVALGIMNNPNATEEEKAWAANIMAGANSTLSNEQKALEILKNPESLQAEVSWAESVMAKSKGDGTAAGRLEFDIQKHEDETAAAEAGAVEESRIAAAVDEQIKNNPALATLRPALIAAERSQSPHPDVAKRGADSLSAGGGGKQQAEIRRVKLSRQRNTLESRMQADGKSAEEIRNDPEHQRLSRSIEMAALSAIGSSGVFERDGQRINVGTGNEHQIFDHTSQVNDLVTDAIDVTGRQQANLDAMDRMTHTFGRAEDVIAARDDSMLTGGLIGQFAQMVGGTNSFLVKKLNEGLRGEQLLEALNEQRAKSGDGSLGLGNLNQTEADAFINALVTFDPALTDSQQLREIQRYVTLNQERSRAKLLAAEQELEGTLEGIDAQLGDGASMGKISKRTKYTLEQQRKKVIKQLEKIPSYFEAIDYDLRRNDARGDAPASAPRFTQFKLLSDSHRILTFDEFAADIDDATPEEKEAVWNDFTDGGTRLVIFDTDTGTPYSAGSQQDYRDQFSGAAR